MYFVRNHGRPFQLLDAQDVLDQHGRHFHTFVRWEAILLFPDKRNRRYPGRTLSRGSPDARW